MTKTTVTDLASIARDVGAILFYAFAGLWVVAPPPGVEVLREVRALEIQAREQRADAGFAVRALNLCLHSIPFRIGDDHWMPKTLHATLVNRTSKWRSADVSKSEGASGAGKEERAARARTGPIPPG